MPWASPRPCITAGCAGRAEYRGRCHECNRAHEERRTNAEPWRLWYRTDAWARIKALVLGREPWCREHARIGQQVKATVVDHITPHRGCADVFWDQQNWQPLCSSCHSRKTASGQ